MEEQMRANQLAMDEM